MAAEGVGEERRSARRGGDGDHFPKVDAASQQARLAYWTKTLATLDGIPFDQLSPEEKVNAQIFRTSLRALANDVRFRTYEAPFNSDTFFWTEFTPRQGFATAGAYRAYLGRLRDVPRYFDEQVANMRAGLARGYTVPRVSVVGRDKTIEPYVKGDTTNPLYAPFAQMPATISAADQAAMRAEAVTLLRDVVAPAYAKAPDDDSRGVSDRRRARRSRASTMPDGDALLPGDDREVHHAEPDGEADPRHRPERGRTHQGGDGGDEAEGQLQRDHGGVLPLPAHRSAVLCEDAARAARVFGVRVEEGRLEARPRRSALLPRRRHGIRPVPDALAPIYTGGRGGLEACLMNTYNLPAGRSTRSRR